MYPQIFNQPFPEMFDPTRTCSGNTAEISNIRRKFQNYNFS